MTNAALQDTLAADTAYLSQLQGEIDYAYAIGEDKPSLADMIGRALYRAIAWIFDTDIPFSSLVWKSIFIILATMLVGWLLTSKVRNGMFRRSKETATDLDEAERDIHHIDFEREIAAARLSGDLSRACRLVYLHTLKRLSDDGRIVWEPSKTPTQYTLEVPGSEFQELTQRFLRIRYGNFSVTEDSFNSMQALHDKVTKGGQP